MVIVKGYPGEEKISWVTVAHVHGPIKGAGWICATEEGNTVLIQGSEGHLVKTYFILDPLQERALIWLARSRRAQEDLVGFTEYLKKNFGKFLQAIGYIGTPHKTNPYLTDSSQWELN